MLVELRRRLGEEERLLDEMFGLTIEARAEGVAAIDETGQLADRRFPVGGTLGHASLLLIDELRSGQPVPLAEVSERLVDLAATTGKHWSKDYVESPDKLTREVVELLVELRLATADDGCLSLLPAAARFTVAAFSSGTRGCTRACPAPTSSSSTSGYPKSGAGRCSRRSGKLRRWRVCRSVRSPE